MSASRLVEVTPTLFLDLDQVESVSIVTGTHYTRVALIRTISGGRHEVTIPDTGSPPGEPFRPAPVNDATARRWVTEHFVPET